ncbi:uncharacterized protein GJ701_000495 [Geothlypis trichas]
MVQDDVIANEKIWSSCYKTPPVTPLEAPALAESCDAPKEAAAKKKDNGPAADQNKVSVRSIRGQSYRGDYKAEGAEKKEDKRTLCNPETDPKGGRKVRASERLPAATSARPCARSAAGERGKGVLPGTASVEDEKEDSDSSWGSKPFSAVLEKVSAGGWHPAADHRGGGVLSAPVESSKGILQVAGRSRKYDNSWDSETESEDEGKASDAVQLPAANCNRLEACSAAVELGKEVLKKEWREEKKEEKVLQPAEGEAKQEYNDSPWDSETESEDEEKVSDAVQLPAANCNRLEACSAAVELGKEVLKQEWREVKKEERVLQPAEGEAQEEYNDSPWDSETESEGEGKASDAVQLPVANCSRLEACSAAVELGKEVLKQEWREVKKEERVLQPAEGEAQEEYNDSPWDSETDSEGGRKVSANVQLPAADQNRVDVSSAAEKRGKAARAEQKEHFMSSSENKGEDLQLKVDSSTQTDSEQDKQLKDLKEPLNKNEYHVDSGKNAQKEKVITILRNMQGILAGSFDSSAAAIPQLEERIQRLQMQMARLEATIQQQAKTIEVLETIQQSLTSDSSVDTSLWHRDFPHAIKNCFGVKCAK